MAAAVDQDRFAGGDVRAFDQPHDGVGHVLGQPNPAQRRIPAVRVPGRIEALAETLVHPLRVDEPRTNRVHPDLRAQSPRQRQGQGIQRALGRGVGDRGAHAMRARSGGHVDHGAVPALLQRRRAGARHLKCPDDIDRIDTQKVVGRQAVEVGVLDELGGAGVVDQRVDAPPLVQRGLGQAAAVGVLGDIRLDQQSFRAGRLARLLRCARRVFALGVVDHHARALAGEHDGGGGADTAG